MHSAAKMDTWQRVKEIFSLVIDEPAEDRLNKIAELCGGDRRLQVEVESWLASYGEAEEFLETPVASHADFAAGKSAAGRRFGSYALEREIGYGGMGAVYLAKRTDGEFEQAVALKIVRQSIAESHMIERFRRERQILASLNHPNIAKLLDGGVSENGEPYLVMEYVEGVPITGFALTLSVDQKLRLFLKVCSALSYAHRNLVVHRDIKPGNILVTSDGEAKLLDFGLAKLIDEGLGLDVTETATSYRALTPAYASPEQLRGDAITTSSDVYSLGVVLHELLAGERPFKFEGMSLDEIIRAVSSTEPALPSRTTATNPKLKGDLDNIILKALRNEPDRRYGSVEQLAEDIERHLSGLPVMARKDTFYYRASKFVMRHRGAVAAALLIMATVVTGVVLTVREKQKADRRFSDLRQLANSLMFEVDAEIQKGPTKGRAMIAKSALDYLDSLAMESGNEHDLQLELAAGYLKVGDIQGKPYRPNLGDTPGAKASYMKALLILESLNAADPANLEARRLLSLCHQSIGRVEQRMDEWDAALESERKAVELSEALVSADPENPQYRSLLGDNYVQFGSALYQAGRGATVEDHRLAIEYFRKAVAIHSNLSAAYPENSEYRYALGVDYEFIGIAFNRIGDMTGDIENHKAALENHLNELEINESLAASDPSNAAFRRIVADVRGEVGLSQLKLGNAEAARDNYRRRLEIFESVMASDPTNVEAIRDVVNCLAELSLTLEKLGDIPDALRQVRKAAELQKILVATEPDNIETARRLQSLSTSVAELQKRHARFESVTK